MYAFLMVNSLFRAKTCLRGLLTDALLRVFLKQMFVADQGLYQKSSGECKMQSSEFKGSAELNLGEYQSGRFRDMRPRIKTACDVHQAAAFEKTDQRGRRLGPPRTEFCNDKQRHICVNLSRTGGGGIWGAIYCALTSGVVCRNNA